MDQSLESQPVPLITFLLSDPTACQPVPLTVRRPWIDFGWFNMCPVRGIRRAGDLFFWGSIHVEFGWIWQWWYISAWSTRAYRELMGKHSTWMPDGIYLQEKARTWAPSRAPDWKQTQWTPISLNISQTPASPTSYVMSSIGFRSFQMLFERV